MTSAQLAEYLLETARVAVVDGAAFGSNGSGHIRLSYSCSYEDCKEGMTRLAEAMRNLCKQERGHSNCR